MALVSMRRALVSVSDKTGLVEFARGLANHGIALVSTGGTFKVLRDAGLEVVEVSEHTGFPEMLDGRVKTLHPKIHGGILHRRDIPEHQATVLAHGIDPIDMVVVSLYPFEQTVARPNVALEEAIEQIDIGGPSMIRSAAKNHSHVAVVTDPRQYGQVIDALRVNHGKLPQTLLRALALAAFERTATYDRAIADYLGRALAPTEEAALKDGGPSSPPSRLAFSLSQTEKLRYGENPHQEGALYVDPACPWGTAASAERLHGKELSYNNLLDLDAALAMVREFDRPAAIVIKHNNPCGAATAETLVDAFSRAYEGDPVSAFGSILGFNRPVDQETALAITEPNRFVEAIVAPSFDAEAFETITTRPTWKKSVRLLAVGDLARGSQARSRTIQIRPIEGGVLCQSADLGPNGFGAAKVVTRKEPIPEQLRDLAFAWIMVKWVRSNAIVLAKNESLLGAGAGQMSRVDSVHMAVRKAGERSVGAALASDAFFPFRDNVDMAAAAGVTSIIQPGGSKRDQESIDACDEHGIAMLFTGVRHFRH